MGKRRRKMRENDEKVDFGQVSLCF